MRSSVSATEIDVWRALGRLGVEVEIAALDRDWSAWAAHVERFRPDVVFNLLEEFRGEGVFDFHPVSWLESQGVAFTGCNPRGLAFTRNKFLTLNVAGALGEIIPKTSRVGRAHSVRYPAFLKYNREHASRGVTRANVIQTPAQLRRAVRRLRAQFDGELIVQDFISGQEVSVGVWGNRRPVALPPWRLCLPGPDDVATATVKFSAAYRRRRGIRAVRLADPIIAKNLMRRAERLFGALDMSGYARFDYRLAADGEAYLIDVNANPSLAASEDFARAAKLGGYSFDNMIARLLDLALRYRPSF